MARPFPALDRSSLECTAGEDRLEGNDAEALSMHEALKSLGTEAGADDSWDAEPSEEGDRHRYEAFVAATTDRAAGKDRGDGAGSCSDEQSEGGVSGLTTQQ